MIRKTISFVACVLFWQFPSLIHAQGSGKLAGQSLGSSPSSSSSTGISIPRNEWLARLKRRPVGAGTTFLCYRLVTLDSSTMPYRIIPYPKVDSAAPPLRDNEGKDVPCTNIDLKHPLMMDAKLVIAIDLRMIPGDLSESPLQVDTQRIEELVFNVQVTAGTTLSPAPIRSAGNAGTTLNLGPIETPNVLFIPWPYEIPGDSVPTLSVSVLYAPPKPGDPWTPNTLYPPGSVVTANPGKSAVAHFFETDHGGQSGDSEPNWNSANAPTPSDSDCNWTWIGGTGSTLPQQFQNKQKLWLPGATYVSGDIIQAPGSSQQFLMNKCGSAFVTIAPAAPNAPAPTPPDPRASCPVPAPAAPSSQACIAGPTWDPKWNVLGTAKDQMQDLTWATELPVTLDGDPENSYVLWILSAPKSGTCSKYMWRAKMPYGGVGQASSICVSTSSTTKGAGAVERWYITEHAGTSGSDRPTFNSVGLSWTLLTNRAPGCVYAGKHFPTWQSGFLYRRHDSVCVPPGYIYSAISPSQDGEYSGLDHPFKAFPVSLSWHDAGPVPPTTVNGLLATEQTLGSLPTITLPQSHNKYSFNIASGLLVTTLRTRSFGYAPTSKSPTTNSGTVIQTGSTLLVDPVVSLTKYLLAFDAEKKWSPKDLIPGLTVSFSLSSPTNNFYVGGSTEFVRYLQFECGYVAARLPQPSTGTFVSPTSTTPPTNMVFHSGAYAGISFNISGLISGMAGSGGGGSGGSSSGKGGNSSSTGN